MSTLKKISIAAALAAGVLSAGVASAADICTGCAYRFANDNPGNQFGAGNPASVAATYIGSYNPNSNAPLAGDKGSFTHGGLATSFTDYWIFQISSLGGAEWDATFNPGSGVSLFSVKVFETSGLTLGSGVGATCSGLNFAPSTLAAGFCGSFGALGTELGSDTSGAPTSALRVSGLALPIGWYAVEVKGTVTVNDPGNFYSGNLTTRPLPEPGSLALVALGMLGAGAAMRRRG